MAKPGYPNRVQRVVIRIMSAAPMIKEARRMPFVTRLATFSIPSTSIFASGALTFTSSSALDIASMIRFSLAGRWSVKSFISRSVLPGPPAWSRGSCASR